MPLAPRKGRFQASLAAASFEGKQSPRSALCLVHRLRKGPNHREISSIRSPSGASDRHRKKLGGTNQPYRPARSRKVQNLFFSAVDETRRWLPPSWVSSEGRNPHPDVFVMQQDQAERDSLCVSLPSHTRSRIRSKTPREPEGAVSGIRAERKRQRAVETRKKRSSRRTGHYFLCAKGRRWRSLFWCEAPGGIAVDWGTMMPEKSDHPRVPTASTGLPASRSTPANPDLLARATRILGISERAAQPGYAERAAPEPTLRAVRGASAQRSAASTSARSQMGP